MTTADYEAYANINWHIQYCLYLKKLEPPKIGFIERIRRFLLAVFK